MTSGFVRDRSAVGPNLRVRATRYPCSAWLTNSQYSRQTSPISDQIQFPLGWRSRLSINRARREFFDVLIWTLALRPITSCKYLEFTRPGWVPWRLNALTPNSHCTGYESTSKQAGRGTSSRRTSGPHLNSGTTMLVCRVSFKASLFLYLGTIVHSFDWGRPCPCSLASKNARYPSKVL